MLPEDLRIEIFARLEKYSVAVQSDIVNIITESLEVSRYELSVSDSNVSEPVYATELYGEISSADEYTTDGATEWNYG